MSEDSIDKYVFMTHPEEEPEPYLDQDPIRLFDDYNIEVNDRPDK
tara:strand:+ start:2660 stop:2794 length:135 start_codon:yes stop_codon:yes gene_type:complete